MAHTWSQKSFPIPAVTELDLSNFHNKHFHHSFRPGQFFRSNRLDAIDETDDGLGFYADGVKRTLTDEQIAMFRHSEIQTLLKEKRRLQLDASDSDGGGSSEKPTAGPDVSASTPQSMADATAPAKTLPKSSNARKRKATTNVDREQGNPTSGYTHRRIAREQDEVVDAHVELDY